MHNITNIVESSKVFADRLAFLASSSDPIVYSEHDDNIKQRYRAFCSNSPPSSKIFVHESLVGKDVKVALISGNNAIMYYDNCTPIYSWNVDPNSSLGPYDFTKLNFYKNLKKHKYLDNINFMYVFHGKHLDDDRVLFYDAAIIYLAKSLAYLTDVADNPPNRNYTRVNITVDGILEKCHTFIDDFEFVNFRSIKLNTLPMAAPEISRFVKAYHAYSDLSDSHFDGMIIRNDDGTNKYKMTNKDFL